MPAWIMPPVRPPRQGIVLAGLAPGRTPRAGGVRHLLAGNLSNSYARFSPATMATTGRVEGDNRVESGLITSVELTVFWMLVAVAIVAVVTKYIRLPYTVAL